MYLPLAAPSPADSHALRRTRALRTKIHACRGAPCPEHRPGRYQVHRKPAALRPPSFQSLSPDDPPAPAAPCRQNETPAHAGRCRSFPKAQERCHPDSRKYDCPDIHTIAAVKLSRSLRHPLLLLHSRYCRSHRVQQNFVLIRLHKILIHPNCRSLVAMLVTRA